MIAKTFQGLEGVLAEELTALGANNIQAGRRMVSFTGDKEMLYRANFALRTAVRVLKPIKHFRAKTADEVYEAVRQIDWSQYLTNDTTFAVDSVVYSNEFRHSKFVAYKVKDAIVDQFREKTGERPNIRVTNPDMQLHIHVAEYDCTLSLDSSGESLHKRGWRQATVEAPINEVLAAGIILQTGWRGECDLVDPMCGSGTILVEAAMIASGIAPGVYRREYAFEKWPDFDRELFDRIYDDDSAEKSFEHHIYGYDINHNIIALATENVRAAGLSKYVTLQQRDIKDFTQPQEKCIMVTNPPYGERISAPDLLGLYKTLGERLKHQFVGNDAWVLSYREECFDQIGLKPSLRIPLFNGSLECELRKYQIFNGKFDEMRAHGGDIKSDEERRLMAQKHRFKQHRDTRDRLEDDPEERMRRQERRPYGRDDRRDGSYRPYCRDDHRPARGSRNDDREEGFDRKPRRFERDGDRRFGRDGDRRFGRDGDRRFGRDDRRFGRDDRSFGRDDRSFGRDDRSFGRDDRRPSKGFHRDGGDERGARGQRFFGHDDRHQRDGFRRGGDDRHQSFGRGDGRGGWRKYDRNAQDNGED